MTTELKTTNVDIKEIIIPTPTVQAGDSVKTFFELCSEADVPSLPYRDQNGRIQGFVTLKRVMGKDCLPNYLVELAGILHNDMNCTTQAMEKIHALFHKPIENYVELPFYYVASDTILIRVVALMEQHSSSFLFVADGPDPQHCDYLGIVTRLSVARKMLQLEESANCE
jgi:hypothetical protein